MGGQDYFLGGGMIVDDQVVVSIGTGSWACSSYDSSVLCSTEGSLTTARTPSSSLVVTEVAVRLVGDTER